MTCLLTEPGLEYRLTDFKAKVLFFFYLIVLKYVCVKSLSHVQLFAIPWAIARQGSLPMEFSRQEYWSGLPFPPAGVLPSLGIKPRPPTLREDSLPPAPSGKPSQQVIVLSKLVHWLEPT